MAPAHALPDLTPSPPRSGGKEGPEGPPAWRARLSPRRRFRARLDRDPRRWVLFIVGMEGLVAPMMNLSEKRESLFSWGPGPALLLVIMATLPATAVVTMLVHGRLLLWTGKLLGGRARPHEIHAAFAWSQAPFVAVGWPLLLEVPLRAAAADLDAVPAWLRWSIDASVRTGAVVEAIAAIAALVGVVLWVKYLAEAQRFSAWRAIANQLLAGVLLVALLGGGIFLAVALVPGSNAIVYGAIGSALALAAFAVALLIERRRRAPAGAR